VGLLTFSQFQSELAQLVANRADLTTPRIIIALNHAQDKISQSQDFKELQNVPVATQTNFTGVPINDKLLPYSSGWKAIHSIVLQYGTDSRKLKQIPWRKFDRMYPSPESVAAYIPLEYTDWNQNLVFMPVPNAVYPLQCRVTLLPAAFTSTTPANTTSLYNGKDEIILGFAASYLWRGYGRYDKANTFETNAAALLDLAKKADSDRPDLDTAGEGDDSEYQGAYWANPFISSLGG
jgi:hypothetical protein